MKILVAYDGTAEAFTAVHDLRRAGLPADVDALVVSVVDARPEFAGPTPAVQEVRLPEDAPPGAFRSRDPFPPWRTDRRSTADCAGALARGDARHGLALGAREHPSLQVATAHLHVASAMRLLGRWFPRWTVRGRVCVDEPFLALVAQAEEHQPDLVVTGARDATPGPADAGRASLSRSLLHALDCSVRVVRLRRQPPDAPLRLMMAYDDPTRRSPRHAWSPRGRGRPMLRSASPLSLRRPTGTASTTLVPRDGCAPRASG